MAEVINVPVEIPSFQQRVQLDGSSYYLSLTINERTDRWHFSLSDANNASIIEGKKMLPGRDLLRGVSSPLKPPGMLMTVDYSGADTVATFENLGVSVFLVYFSFDEVQAITNGQ